MNPVLSMQGGAFAYRGGKEIFRDLDFDLAPGEVLCILGPNGCGKTTLLDTLLGYHRLAEGALRLGERPVQEMNAAERARELAYVPQIHEKTFPYTVEQVIMMGRAAYLPLQAVPGEDDAAKVDEIIAMMNLEELRHAEYTRLSGGETQLVLIARALVQESRILVMDEPTSHLDFTNELVILESMVRLIRERGLSIIMATHVPNHAFYFENRRIPVRVALMQNGAFRRVGPPEEVLTPESLGEVYRVETRVLQYLIGDDARPLRHIVPINLTECI